MKPKLDYPVAHASLIYFRFVADFSVHYVLPVPFILYIYGTIFVVHVQNFLWDGKFMVFFIVFMFSFYSFFFFVLVQHGCTLS